MDVAAGISGFIGLVGQTLQGINFLINFFDDSKSAPKVIQNVLKDLETIKSILQAVENNVTEQDSNTTSFTLNTSKTATERVQTVIAEFVDFIEQHAGTLLDPSSGRMHSFRKGWQRCSIARKDKELATFSQRLLQAKQTLMLVIEVNHISITQTAARTLQSHYVGVQSAIQRESQAIKMQIQSNQTTGTQILSLGEDLKGDISKLHDAVTLANMKTDRLLEQNNITEALQNLPMLLRPVFKAAINEAMSQHRSEYGLEPTPPSVHQNEPTKRPKHSRHSKTRRLDQVNTQISTYTMERAVLSEPLQASAISRLSPKRQKQAISTHKFWFGSITVATRYTEQDERCLDSSSRAWSLQATQTVVRYSPNTWFFKIGLILEKGDSQPNHSSPLLDCRFKVFYIHDANSMPQLTTALGSIDYHAYRELLHNRLVTPYDLIILDSKVEVSLLEYLLLGIRNIKPAKSQSWMELFGSLIESSEVTRHIYLRYGIEGILDKSPHLSEPLARAVIEKSKIDLTNVLFNSSYDSRPVHIQRIRRLLLHQEIWDLADTRREFETFYGKGSWAFIIEEGREGWEDEQEKQMKKSCQTQLRDNKWLRQQLGSVGRLSFSDIYYSRLLRRGHCKCTDCAIGDVAFMFDHGTWELSDPADCRCFDCTEVSLQEYLLLLGEDEDDGAVISDLAERHLQEREHREDRGEEEEEDDEAYDTANEE